MVDPYANTNSDSNSYTDGDSYTHQLRTPTPDAYSYAYSYADSYGDSYWNPHLDSDTYPYCDANSNSNAYTYSYTLSVRQAVNRVFYLCVFKHSNRRDCWRLGRPERICH